MVTKNFKVNSIYYELLFTDNPRAPLWKQSSMDEQKYLQGGAFHLHSGDPCDENQLTRRLESAEKFSLYVHYQYDQGLAPCSGSKTFHYKLAHDGQPQYLGACW
jgi:hypothetical protein